MGARTKAPEADILLINSTKARFPLLELTGGRFPLTSVVLHNNWSKLKGMATMKCIAFGFSSNVRGIDR